MRKRVIKSAPERRRELLDAALVVFRTRGASEATIDDITAQAGVAKGTFYRYYASKEAILVALRSEVGSRIIENIATQVPPPWTKREHWWAAVDAAIVAFIDYLLDNADEHQALWHGSASAIGPSASDPTFTALVALLQEGAGAGVFRVDDPWLVVMVLFGALHAAVDHALTRDDLDRAVLYDELRRVAHRTLEP